MPGKKWMKPIVRLDAALAKLPSEQWKPVEARVIGWLTGRTAHLLRPLIRLEALAGTADTPPRLRALYAAIVASGGVLIRKDNDPLMDDLPVDLRRTMRQAGIIPGALALYLPQMMKPIALQWLAALLAVHGAKPGPIPHWQAPWSDAPHPAFYRLGTRALRIDLVERIIGGLHKNRNAREVMMPDPALAISMGMQEAEWHTLLRSAGFRQKGEGWAWQGLPKTQQKRWSGKQKSGSGHFSGLKELVGDG